MNLKNHTNVRYEKSFFGKIFCIQPAIIVPDFIRPGGSGLGTGSHHQFFRSCQWQPWNAGDHYRYQPGQPDGLYHWWYCRHCGIQNSNNAGGNGDAWFCNGSDISNQCIRYCQRNREFYD